jgi:hypothetical protein
MKKRYNVIPISVLSVKTVFIHNVKVYDVKFTLLDIIFNHQFENLLIIYIYEFNNRSLRFI